jgi:hypothetical protein
MCGIHAVFNVDTVYNSKATKFMEQGFIAGSLRGIDSSGLFVVDKKGHVDIHKMALSGSNFIESKRSKGMLSDVANCIAAIGHVRAATTGKVNIDNAHPFTAWDSAGNKVIGVHNGTLSDWRSNVGAHFYDVDSDWAIQHIADEKFDAFENFHGAYCFMWWRESEPEIIHVARNDARPMNFVITPDDKTMFLGSESGMVAWLADRNDIKAKDNKIYVIEPGFDYAFDLSDKAISWTKTELPKPIVKRATYSTTMGYTSSTTTQVTSGGSQGSSFGATGQLLVKNVNNLIDTAALEDAYAELDGEKPSMSLVPIENVATKRERRRAAAAADEARKTVLLRNSEGEYVLPDEYFMSEGATAAEKQAAKATGAYGMLQVFLPSHYEFDTEELFGEIEDFDESNGKVKYQAVMRGIKPKVADSLYMNGKATPWCAVIGITPGDKQYVVLGELSEEGDTKLNKAV